ncbi:MAG: IS481 family transposase [Aquabacterium sp.]|nr:MAG: IS481 family transposase [Aquabacterium sp.]
MPWSLATVKEQREEFVQLARQPQANISELCRRFGISRKTGYKWLGREDLEDRSRRPQTSPRRTLAEQESQVVAMRAAHPAWGARKIAHVLARDHGIEMATSTAHSVLKRHGLISAEASRAARPWQRFEHEAPNALWQMDFKGHIPMARGRCHPLTVLDDHSRFNLVLQALDNERRADVQQALQAAFERYGLPDRINADNGAPWGTSTEALTGLGVWLIRLGVQLGHSRPLHPQTNGKDERFHRTLNEEVLCRRLFSDLDHAQQAFDVWRHAYNHYRPHEAIGMGTPAQRYQASPRAMPGVLPTIGYDMGEIVRKVNSCGFISYKNRRMRVGKALMGQHVALRRRPGCNDVFDVYFGPHRLKTRTLVQNQ